MHRLLHTAILGIALSLCLTSYSTCQASAPDVSACAYVLMEADSGRVLAAHNELQERSIASTTKIMTALVALEHSVLSDRVTVKSAHLKEGSSMYLRAGETLTMEELLYGLLLPSGNDAAECIADFCGGKEQFVAWMNEKAARLGMEHTAFANPSGLDEQGHYSCARDMAVLAAHAMRQPVFLRLASTKNASVGSRTMSNHNKLLSRYDGCIGLKTGYTGEAGRTLVTCVERDGMRLIAVTLYDGNDWQDHTALYDYGFSAYRLQTPIHRGTPVASVAVRGGKSVFVQAVAQADFSWPTAEGETLTTRVCVKDAVDAPVPIGGVLGEIAFYSGDTEVGRIALVADAGVETVDAAEQISFTQRLIRLLRQGTGK